MDPRALLRPAIAAVAAASRAARYVQTELGRIQEVTKDDRSPVTAADFAAQAVIAHALSGTLQPLAIVGEERSAALVATGAEPLRSAVLEAVRMVWQDASMDDVISAIDSCGHDASAPAYYTLDPVDGTKGFLRRGQYAISLALVQGGQVLLGVLGCPNLSADFERSFDQPDEHGLIYYASRGGGSWVVPGDAAEAAPAAVHLQPRGAHEPLRVCESVDAGHSNQDDSARIIARLGAASAPMRLDSQCKYAVVARGQADVYLRLPTRSDYVEKVWDHAAGAIIAQEAGAVVTDIRGAPLDFGQGVGLNNNSGVVCAAPHVHGRIVEAIQALGR